MGKGFIEWISFNNFETFWHRFWWGSRRNCFNFCFLKIFPGDFKAEEIRSLNLLIRCIGDLLNTKNVTIY